MTHQRTAAAQLRKLADELETATGEHDVLRVLVLAWNVLRKCAKALKV